LWPFGSAWKARNESYLEAVQQRRYQRREREWRALADAEFAAAR
jgi:hypothetical protein